MQDPECNLTLDQLLEELKQILDSERDAVTHMESDQIEQAAAAKLRLNQLLASRRQELTPTHEERMRSIRNSQRHNLILLAHARDLLQNALGIQDARLLRGGAPGRSTVERSRLDLRG
ncbi:MAG TPA: hypothetical protein VKP30_29870 [Polyangiaceae bacterium]|nr:hypothetical protein [Polyangiaceae bacterium]